MENQLSVRFDLIFNTSTTLNKDEQQVIQIASANGLNYFVALKNLVDVVEEELLKNPKFTTSDTAINDTLELAQDILKRDMNHSISIGELNRIIIMATIKTTMYIK